MNSRTLYLANTGNYPKSRQSLFLKNITVISIEKMKLVYPEKQQAYLALASELSRLVDSNGNGYDRIKLISLLNRALILCDEKTEEALLGVRNVCFNGESPWNYAVYALRQMSRELRDTQAQIDKSHRRCK